MLILERHAEEEIVIAGLITVRVLKISGGQGGKVALGVTAPKEIPVHRREVFEAIKRDRIAEEGQ